MLSNEPNILGVNVICDCSVFTGDTNGDKDEKFAAKA